MQLGSLTTRSLLDGPDVWQFRWFEKSSQGRRVYRKRIIGTIEQYPNAEAARSAVSSLITEVSRANLRTNSITITVAQLCSHFEQRELAKSRTWRSCSTKKAYVVYLRRWIIPHWGRYQLREVRTIEVESWLRRLPLARSSCAKIRGLMSGLVNHACRYEFFEHSPIRLVRQRAKRKGAPNLLAPEEINTLVNGLALRGKTLVLIAASTGLRQRVIWLEVGRHQLR